MRRRRGEISPAALDQRRRFPRRRRRRRCRRGNAADVAGAPSVERAHPVGDRGDGGGVRARIELFHHVAMQLSKPSRIVCSGSSRPMKTTRLSRALAVLPFRAGGRPPASCARPGTRSGRHRRVKARMPLERRIFWPSAGDQVLQPGHEFGRRRAACRVAQRQRLHVLVVVVLQAAVVVVIVIMAVMCRGRRSAHDRDRRRRRGIPARSRGCGRDRTRRDPARRRARPGSARCGAAWHRG